MRTELLYFFCQQDFVFMNRSETSSFCSRSLDCFYHNRVRMPQDQWIPRTAEIKIPVAIYIMDIRSLSTIHIQGCATNRFEGTDRRVDPPPRRDIVSLSCKAVLTFQSYSLIKLLLQHLCHTEIQSGR